MTVIRRILALVLLTVGVMVGASVSASAAFPDAVTVAAAVSTGAVVDANHLAYQQRSVTTFTTYGWTAQSAVTGYISC